MVKEIEFHREKLDNGVTVIFEKRKIPVVAVASSIKFGSQYESENIKGISHFIEHLVFKGTKKRTVTEIAQTVESKGGIINAFTSEEITAYRQTLRDIPQNNTTEEQYDLLLARVDKKLTHEIWSKP